MLWAKADTGVGGNDVSGEESKGGGGVILVDGPACGVGVCGDGLRRVGDGMG